MENTEININSNNENVVAVIDGVVYEKRPRGRPKNPLRWREDGKYLSGMLDREKRLEYTQKYKVLKTCEFCGKEQQIMHYNRHLKSSKCALSKELKEIKEKLIQIESTTN